jgi:hypothetical protein
VDCSKKQVASGQSPKAKLGIMSYKNLEIWQLAREIALKVHKMTLEDLPKFEMYETGQQIRRSSKSCRSTIVEGYGRKRYQNEMKLTSFLKNFER